MIVRVLLALSAVLFGDVRAAESTYVRAQNFESLPDNWIQSSPAQFYGYERTRIVGLTGAAGGLFQPGAGFNNYADYYLGGAFSRGTFLYAEGRLALKRASAQPPYRTTTYVGYFGRPVKSAIETVGFALIGHGEDKVYAAAVVQYSNGEAFSGNWVSLPVGKGDYLGWKYFWNPTGGHGYGSLVVQIGSRNTSLYIPPSASAYDFSVNAFGLFQPSFVDANANSFLWAYVGALAYTAGVGEPPKLRVNRPRSFSVTATDISFHGTASLNIPGYRLKSVSYRTIYDGRTSARRPVRGLKKWNCRIRVKTGLTRIRFYATSDSGATRTIERRVSNRLVTTN